MPRIRRSFITILLRAAYSGRRKLHSDACSEWQLHAKCAAAGSLRGGFMARYFAADGQLWIALRHFIWIVHRVWTQPAGKSRTFDAESFGHPACERRAARLPSRICAASGNCVLHLGQSNRTVLHAGFGMYYNDLAQNGWVTAFQAVNSLAGPCVAPSDPGCLTAGSQGALIDGRYRTPYAIHSTAGIEHAFNAQWLVERRLHARAGKSWLQAV